MPWAIVGEPQTGHGGLLTNLKNDRLNHLDPKSQIVGIQDANRGLL